MLSYTTFSYACLKCVLSGFRLVWLFEISWTVALQAPLSMGFSRQQYWSGLPCPPPGNLPNPGIKPTFLEFPALAGGFFTTSATQMRDGWLRAVALGMQRRWVNISLEMQAGEDMVTTHVNLREKNKTRVTPGFWLNDELTESVFHYDINRQ